MSHLRVVALEPQPLTPAGFAPFGALPPDEGSGPTADLEFLLDDGWVNYIGHTLDEVEVVDGSLRCDVLNRHDTHTQTLMPVSGDAIIVVAPAECPMDASEHLETARAFVMRRYECAHLHRGTWHWGPYPLDADSVRIFNIQGRGYPTDNGVAALRADLGAVLDVPLG
ncbi:MAG: ureidoglycolate hydrolase [Actinomycetia bacterium]|nr:ureidoglycolate hydrolase [Actinomycetes bacterium]